MKLQLHPIALLLALAGFPTLAHATIINGGNIINQTWTLAGSPYNVLGDITIPAGSFLTIQAGVDVRFASTDGQGSGLDVSRVELTVAVNGTLNIQGTALQPVTLRADVGTNPSTWYGIVVSAAPTNFDIRGVVVTHAVRGVFNQQAAGLIRIEDATFEANSTDLHLSTGTAPLFVGTIRGGTINGSLSIPAGARFELNRPLGVTQAGSFSLASGAFYRTTLTTTFNYRRLQVPNFVTLGGTLELDLSSYSGSVGDVFTLIDNNGPSAVNGTFAGLPEGAEFNSGATRFRINYAAGSGANDVRLTQVVGICDLALTKSAPAETLLAAGGLEYLLTVINNGPSPAEDVSVRDSLPAGLRYLSATPSQGTCAESGGIVTCSLGDLAASASATVSIEVSFDFDTITVVNSAVATSSNGDTNSVNNAANSTTLLTPATTAVFEGPALPNRAGLGPWARPNPGSGATRVFFRAPAGSRAELEIFDAGGRRVREMELRVGDEAPAFRWDGRDASGVSVGPGVYYYRVRVDGRTLGSEKSVLLR